MMLGLREILIVDDEEDIREILAYIAHQNNIPYHLASSGQEALEIYKNNNISCIVSDIAMPNGDGHFLLQEVRALGDYVPFIFITAYEDQSHLHQALKYGAFDFISKPFNSEEVVSSFFRALDLGVAIKEALMIEENHPLLLKKQEEIQRLLSKLSRYGLLK